MSVGLDALAAHPWKTVGALIAIGLLICVLGVLIRRLTGRMSTMRAQLLVITSAGVTVGAVSAWFLAALMVVEEDQLGPIFAVLVLTAIAGSALVIVASGGLGGAAHQLSLTVASIEAGDRGVRSMVHRRDELGRIGEALDQLNERLGALESERERLDAERSLMLSSISHDLRSPLSALRAAVEAMIDGVATDPNRYLRSMRADVDALTSLVDDIFLMTRLDGGRMQLDREPIDLAECCDEAIEVLAPAALQHGIRLKIEALEHVQVMANQRALGRVIRNLLDNAIRHAPQGSVVTITVGTGNRPRVTVSDEGDGFPPEFADAAFELWSRADESRSRSTGGAGLGLAIARGLVSAQGGRIWVSGPPGGHVSFELEAR
jgi:signal transduction histidine kinase